MENIQIESSESSVLSALKTQLGGIMGPVKLTWFLYSKHPELKSKLENGKYDYDGLNSTEKLYMSIVEETEKKMREQIEDKIAEIRFEMKDTISSIRNTSSSILR